MHPDNHFYGHDRVLAEFCNVDPAPILGHLQHGWGPGTGYSQMPLRLLRSLPRIVWSSTNAERSRAELGGAVHAIGAPYCYLLEMLGVPPLPDEPSTLFFPAHGWERHSIAGDYQELIEQIESAEAGRAVTVCLYWNEFEQPPIRRQFEAAGFRVITHGRRNDPSFLFRFRDELRLHDRVAANNVGTPIWYSAFGGRSVEVYGPRFDFGDAEARRAEEKREQRQWSAVVSGGVDGARARAIAETELGADCMLSPSDLAVVLGWNARPTKRRRVVALGEHHVRRAVANVGMRVGIEGYR